MFLNGQLNQVTQPSLLVILGQILLTILLIVFLLIAVAYYTLAERKVMASIQRRLGPNVVGP
jgi:NADH-quinone oxidoreductase subunit H